MMTLPDVALNARGFVLRAYRRFIDDRCQRVAGALSFTTLLAIVPLTAVMVAVLSLFPVFGAWMEVIQEFIYSNFVPTAGDVVQKYLTQFAAKAGKLTAVGALFLIVTAIMLMATIEQAFNDIWRVANTRKMIHRFLAYWALMTLGPLLIAVGLAVTTHLFTALPFSAPAEAAPLSRLLSSILPMMLEFAGIALLFTVVPNVAVPWRDAFMGSALTVALLEAAKALFAAVMTYFVTSYKLVYGAVAVLPIFLLWIYISWVIILTGAIVTACLGEIQPDGTREPADPAT